MPDIDNIALPSKRTKSAPERLYSINYDDDDVLSPPIPIPELEDKGKKRKRSNPVSTLDDLLSGEDSASVLKQSKKKSSTAIDLDVDSGQEEESQPKAKKAAAKVSSRRLVRPAV